MKKISIPLIAIVLVFAILVTGFTWPGFLLGFFEKGPVDQASAEDKKDPEPIVVNTGHSDAFSIEPMDGVTISAEKDALDKNRTFNISELNEEELEEAVSPLVDEAYEIVYPLGGMHIDTGLGADGILPGYYTIELDLAERGIPEELWDKIAVYRRDDNGYYSEYITSLKNGVLTVESYQNGVIFWIVSVGVIYLCADVFLPSVGSGLKWFERCNSIYVTETEDVNSKKIFKLKWTFSSGEDLYIKRKAQLFENIRQNCIKANEVQAKFQEEYGRRWKSGEELMAYKEKVTEQFIADSNDSRCVEYRDIENTLEQLRKERGFSTELVLNIAKGLRGAYAYMKHIGVKVPKNPMTVEMVPKITGADAAGVTISPLLFLSNYLVIQTEGLLGDQSKFDMATVTACHEYFHACCACYKAQNNANVKLNEAMAQIVELDCRQWLKDKGYISSIPGSENAKYLELYALPLDKYSATFGDGSSVSYSGKDKSDAGYPLYMFIQYLMKKYPQATDQGSEWHNILSKYGTYWGTPDVTQFLKDTFGLTEESLSAQYYLFAVKNQAKFYERAKSSIDQANYNLRWAFPWTSAEYPMRKIEISDLNYSLRVRCLGVKSIDNYDGKYSILIVTLEDFQEKTDMKLVPINNEKFKKTKYGLLYEPQDPWDTYEDYIMEIDGGLGSGGKTSYEMWVLIAPEVPEAKVESGLLKFTLPEKSEIAKAGYTDGIRVTIKCSDGTETVKHYKHSGAGKEISLRVSSLHGTLPEGTDEKDLRFTISVAEYINERDGSRTYGPDSSDTGGMDAALKEAGALEGEITISLYWQTLDDLDLHCTTPSGAEIAYYSPSNGGGTLDVDANASSDSASTNAVENIYFTDPDQGEYTVWIYNYSDRTEDSDSSARLRIKVGDKTILDKKYTLGYSSEKFTFTYGGDGTEFGSEHLDR